ncbi:alpha/beta hydrolase [Geobacter sp.]|uniref:alpha/beta hydrolase n=1 Tax=Geobacter sp. TaxID=46610 RepID=UPI0027B89A9A|nr:alpha/beta hydrolase [Geobacter sp.]
MRWFPKGIIGLALATLLVACVRNEPYRTVYEPCTVAQKGAECRKSSLEQNDEYLLGFVEFDDQGWFWDRKQADTLIDRLLEKDELESGLLMVVYVHGWRHNASFDDNNVASFRETLKRIYSYEHLASQSEGRPERKVAGIYVGWRGLSANVEPFRTFSFWDRKNTADKVGHGALTDLLVRLEEVQFSHLKVYDSTKSRLAQTKLIVVGHSFGGEMVYSALSQILIDRFSGDAESPQTFGDLVILVNPAFEASRFTPLHDLAGVRKWYADGQLPLVAIFTSETDQATKAAFPIGRHLSTLFEKYRPDGDVQKQADRQAVGHFAPYRTHELRPRPAAEAAAPQASEAEKKVADVTDFRNAKSARQQWIDLSSRNGWSLDLGSARLTHQGKSLPRNPLYVVAVDKQIIKDHGDIWNPRFLDFMRQFILFTTIVEE